MVILVRYFAILREQKGVGEEKIHLSETMSVAALYAKLFGCEPNGMRFAINEVYVDEGQIVKDGDEVVFLPPLGGG